MFFICQNLKIFTCSISPVKTEGTWTSEIAIEFLDKTNPLGVPNTQKKFATFLLVGNTFVLTWKGVVYFGPMGENLK